MHVKVNCASPSIPVALIEPFTVVMGVGWIGTAVVAEKVPVRTLALPLESMCGGKLSDAFVPFQVPPKVKATSLKVSGLMEQVPSGFLTSLYSTFVSMTLPWMGPGRVKSRPVIVITSTALKLLEHRVDRDRTL